MPDPAVPTDLYELERFSQRDLRRWLGASETLDELQRELHFGLESQRRGDRTQLLDALRVKPAPTLNLQGWIRIVEFRYCLDPLSAAGSLRCSGGRFNVGQDLGIAIGTASWPALYIAEDFETAFREKFQVPSASKSTGLTPEELALQDSGSYLVALLRGEIHSVLDLGDREALKPFCQKIAQFELPGRVRTLARSLGVRPAQLVRSPALLQRMVLSSKWRVIPTQFELPAPSQVFGELVQSAGYEAMTYQSSQGGGQCAVIFPTRMAESSSYVELQEGYPEQVRLPRLDRNTWHLLTSP
ncbi:MAG: RES family NAD+ phosphorylase [Steroidobacteraceae bacterium]